ncbi:serine/threonine-protein phosphatase 4 regulatory subunit 1 [Ditylenchus destructor]|nr:serine/threonine-protein phosphatase 4 regulatory subunit 1 [Ditylenchus destructor]
MSGEEDDLTQDICHVENAQLSMSGAEDDLTQDICHVENAQLSMSGAEDDLTQDVCHVENAQSSMSGEEDDLTQDICHVENWFSVLDDEDSTSSEENSADDKSTESNENCANAFFYWGFDNMTVLTSDELQNYGRRSDKRASKEIEKFYQKQDYYKDDDAYVMHNICDLRRYSLNDSIVGYDPNEDLTVEMDESENNEVSEATFEVPKPEQELEEYMKYENKDKLLAIYDKYLENHSLRPILLKNLASYFKALPEKDRDKAAQSFPDFMPVDDSNSVYKTEIELAEQLAQIVHLFEPVKVNKFFSRLALILSSDRISGVRTMGVKLLAKVIGVLIQEEWMDYSNKYLTHPDAEFLPLSNQIIHQIRRTFWTIGNWQQRQSFGRLLATLLQKKLIDDEQFCFLFGEDVMRISEDEVPNVRQYFCVLGQITSSSDFFRATHEGISAAIRDKLQEFVVHDSDAEIRYQAQIALEQAELQNETGETNF